VSNTPISAITPSGEGLALPSSVRPRARRWRLGGRFTRYVVREIAFPTVFALLGLTVLAIATDLVGYADLVLNRGWGASEVGTIALFRTVPMFGRVIPFAALLGPLVALGRLGADREILALEASGVSLRRLVAPVALVAAALAVPALAISTVVAPWANRSLNAVFAAAAQRNAGTVLRSGAVNTLGRWRIQAQEVSSDGTRLRGLALWVPPLAQTVFAQSASVEQAPGGGKRLLIENGAILRRDEGGPAYVRFDRMQQEIGADEANSAAEAADWISAAPLEALAEATRAETDPVQRYAAAAEWQRRFALPAAVAILGLLAVPLLLRGGQMSRAGGALLGVVAIAVYMGLLQLSDAMLHADGVPVAVAVWFPDAVLAAAAVGLLARPRGVGSGERGWLRRRPTESRSKARSESALRPRRFVLDRYVAIRFAETAALCFAGMLVALVLVDIVENLQWFTRYHSTLDEVARFYAARMPVLVARVVPMALLVGAAVTMSLLGVTGELLGMRACGIAALRPSLPILALCGVVAGLYHVVIDQVVPHAAARALQIKRFEIKNQLSEQVSVWTRMGDRLYEADRLDPMRGVAQGLTVYEVGDDGLPRARTDAVEARHVGRGTWQLDGPERIEVTSQGPAQLPADGFIQLGDDLAAEVSSSGLTIRELRQEIRRVEHRGYDATPYRVDLQTRIAAPLACLVLPALALLIAATGPPFPKPAQIILLSAGVGVAWSLLSAAATSLGYRGTVPPAIGGWSPSLALLALAIVLAIRLRRLGL
jgi:lipopolysaccharide export system permease protein